jgi:predicted secreted Zn-dependent protease
MTDEEKEIRDAERKALAECRQWRRKLTKKLNAMTPEERQEYWRKDAEEMRARGFNVG